MQLELERLNRANVQKNFLFTGELLRLLAIFQQKAIPVAVFKGPVLAHSVYGDLSLREFSDVDVLVHEEDLRKAEHILIASGYRADFPDRDFRSAFLHYQGQYAFRNRETGIPIDLHWRLSSKGLTPISSKEIWRNLSQVTIADRTVPTLAQEDLVLFLAGHGTKERWRSLVWSCDFAELLSQHQNLDWIAIFERAERAHCSRPLLLAILLASELLDAPAPPELLRQARNNSAIRKLAEAAKVRMLRTTPEGELSEFLSGLDTYSELRYKVWTVATLLTTRTVGDYEAMPLPKPLWSIYYFTRPFRLAGKLAELMLLSNGGSRLLNKN